MKCFFKLLLLGLFVFLSNNLSAQLTENLSFSDQIKKQFFTEVLKMPQEKLYLHTDKPYYSAGENIWFKGYLLNAVTHLPNALSQFLYVELIDKSDSVFQRVKIRKDSLGFSGAFKLSSEIPLGFYTLRAYSYWMRNVGSDFFFSKNIFIGNPIDVSVNGSISYSKPVNGSVIASIRFTDAQNNPIVDKKVNCVLNWNDKKNSASKGSTNKDGSVSFTIKLDTSSYKNKSMEVSFSEREAKYHQTFLLPTFTEDFDVQFFPEGGTLIENGQQVVAFKAIGSNGLSVDVTGSITDSTGNKYFDFESVYKGMGKFILNALSNQIFYANVKTSNGLEKRFKLSPASKEGVAIQVIQNRGKIFYEIINKTNIDSKSLYLLIHSRGNVLAIQPLDSTTLSGQIPETSFPSGILSFSVINQLSGQTLTERTTFIVQPLARKMIMKTDKPIYNRRQDVNLSFNLMDKDSIPVVGNFSLSVTDNQLVRQDTLADNILTNILLTSDLKGFIEDPAAYFMNTNKSTLDKLDLLMLTQGWKRFNTSDIVSGKKNMPKFYLERGQALSGKVLNVFNKPEKNATIYMISGFDKTTKMSVTDNMGRYLFDGIEFPDSSRIALKAKSTKLISNILLVPDPDEYAQESAFVPLTKSYLNAVSNLSDYFSQSKEKYFSEGGLSMINLKEVNITSDKKKNASSENFYYGKGDVNIGSEELSNRPLMDLVDLLNTVPGVNVYGNRFYIRGRESVVLLDHRRMTFSDLEMTMVDEVESLSVFKSGSAAFSGSQGINGVIVFTSRRSPLKSIKPRARNIAIVKPLGFQKPIEFYIPKYNVDSVYKSKLPDLRTTIYWNPSINSDALGNIIAKFPTADKANDYNVILEGVSAKGEVFRYTGIIKRK